MNNEDKMIFKSRYNEMLSFEPVNEKLKEKKNKEGLKNIDIAELCGVSAQNVGHWSAGKNLPDLSKIKILANAFDIDPAWLLGFTDTPKTKDRDSYAPFETLGFSEQAWKNLTKVVNNMKARGLNKEEIREQYSIRALNNILENTYMKRQAVINDTDTEVPNEEGTTLSIKRTVPVIDFALLRAIDRYITFSASTISQTPKGAVQELVSKYENADSLEDFTAEFENICLPLFPEQLDMQYMSEVQLFLRNMKIKYIEKAIDNLNPITPEIYNEVYEYNKMYEVYAGHPYIEMDEIVTDNE